MADEVEAARRFKEFDCPDCAANNPLDDGFSIGDDIQCMFCGLTFKVKLAHGGKFKLEEN